MGQFAGERLLCQCRSDRFSGNRSKSSLAAYNPFADVVPDGSHRPDCVRGRPGKPTQVLGHMPTARPEQIAMTNKTAPKIQSKRLLGRGGVQSGVANSSSPRRRRRVTVAFLRFTVRWKSFDALRQVSFKRGEVFNTRFPTEGNQISPALSAIARPASEDQVV